MNQRFPSGPTVIPCGPLYGVGTGKWFTVTALAGEQRED